MIHPDSGPEKSDAKRADVVVVVPPFATASYPALGPSILAAGCSARGLTTELLYANLLFATRVGFERYEGIACSSVRHLAGEGVFREHAFPGNSPQVDLIEAVFAMTATIPTSWPSGTVSQDDVRACAAHVDPFLDEAVERILDHRPLIVGISTVFQQNLAAISLLNRLKAACPEIITVLGGGNAAEPMGSALAEIAPAADFIFSGEADFRFPAFCLEILAGSPLPAHRLVDCGTVPDLDRVPTPDYSAYYSQVSEHSKNEGLPESLPYWLHFETSRGCWFGAKSHCKFCGLNGPEIAYRKKSAERALSEIHHLVTSYAPERLAAADNIMPLRFREQVLPRLGSQELGVEFFYEVKANLREEDLDQFVLSGVLNIQPGIESLATNPLQRMAKGVSALQNIWLLRECSSRHIHVSWNLLTGIPGETRADYESMLDLLPALEHLQPPNGPAQLRFDRYSPYFMQAAEHGVSNLRPFPIYRDLYPDRADLDGLAYHFTGDYTTDYLASPELQERLEESVTRWRSSWRGERIGPRLFGQKLTADHMVIEDTRSCAVERFIGLSRPLLGALGELHRPTRCDRVPPDQLGSVRALQDLQLVIEHEDHFLAIVTSPEKGLRLRKSAGVTRRSTVEEEEREYVV